LQGDAGATFVHKEIERVIDTASAILFTFFNPGKVLVLIGKSDPSGDCGSVTANNYFTECAESRSKPLLDQARAILTNRHDIAQHFFTHRLTVEIVEEAAVCCLSFSGSSGLFELLSKWMSL
jgi:hypothetical protein